MHKKYGISLPAFQGLCSVEFVTLIYPQKLYFRTSEDLVSIPTNSPVSALMLAARWK
jgi:hypothetical protein